VDGLRPRLRGCSKNKKKKKFGSRCQLEKRKKNFDFWFSISKIPKIPKLPKLPKLHGRSREKKKVFSA
jgi:hypothetical protein